jgi:hypothetical protein
MPDYNPDREIALARLQYDHQLATTGLQGTLKGALASMVGIVAVVIAQVTTDRYVVQGWAFAAMVAAIVVPITFYGAFIFNRALNVSAKIAKESGSFTASSSPTNEPGERP